MNQPRIMLAGVRSGSGKTTLVCGLLAALVKKGKKPCSFKCGPDYIDPMFHRRVIGVASHNLDPFFCTPEEMKRLIVSSMKEADIGIVEGVMGYYDGLGFTEEGSSWSVAAATGTPAVLIADGSGCGRSVMAQLAGFVRYREDSGIRGVIFNRMPEKFYSRAAEEARDMGLIPLGYVPKLKEMNWESRHLGLVTAEEIPDLKQQLDRLGEVLTGTVDLDGIEALAAEAQEPGVSGIEELADVRGFLQSREGRGPVRLALAEDRAFCFTYQDNLDFLKLLGCDLVPFSPLKDRVLPDNIGGLILSGGYPELSAGELSENRSMLDSIRENVRAGLPCLAECGGFMVLQEELEDDGGRLWPEAGLLPGICRRTDRLQRFGYRILTAAEDSLLAAKGDVLRAHEFHYWESSDPGSGFLSVKASGGQECRAVHTSENLYAGFPHLYYYGNRQAVYRLLRAAEAYQTGR